MKTKDITTACGLVMALGGIPVITTASNDGIKIYPFPINTKFSTLESPSNYAAIKQKSEIFAVSDVIKYAEKTLGLSKQHLADIFVITRQNLYNLLNNPEQIPNLNTENRAKQVNKALDVINSIYPHKLGASTLTVRIDDKRLFDVLKEDEICLEQVKHFSEVIAKRISRQSQSNLPERIIEQQAFLSRPNAI